MIVTCSPRCLFLSLDVFLHMMLHQFQARCGQLHCAEQPARHRRHKYSDALCLPLIMSQTFHKSYCVYIGGR